MGAWTLTPSVVGAARSLASHIHYNLSARADNTAYVAGNRVSSSGYAFECTSPGITSGSSTLTAPSDSVIIDGTSVWRYLSPIDYTSLVGWESSLPGTLTEPVAAWVWNNGEITTSAGSQFVILTGHATSPTNHILITAAPGESFKDKLAHQQGRLGYDGTQGVAFRCPDAAAVSPVSYLDLRDDNVILDGLQFRDPNTLSTCSIVGTVAGQNAFTVRDCIFEGTAQSGATFIVGVGSIIGPFTMTNCLVIDHQPVDGEFGAVSTPPGPGPHNIVNCTFVSINRNSGAGLGIQGASGPSSVLNVTNCAFVGYFSGMGDTAAGVATGRNCAFASPNFSYPSGSFNDGGGNVFSVNFDACFIVVPALQWPIPLYDFRLVPGSALFHAGLNASSVLTTADDIAGDPRGTSWDIGCWQTNFACTGSASIGPIAVNSSAAISNDNPYRPITLAPSVVATAVAAYPASGGAILFTPTLQPNLGNAIKPLAFMGQVKLIITLADKVYDVPIEPKPTYLVPTLDPIFMTKITRLAGDAGTTLPSPFSGHWGKDVRHEYSNHQPWNASSELLMIQNEEITGGGPNRLFLDGTAYNIVKTTPGSYPDTAIYEERWHPRLEFKNVIVLMGGTHLLWYDIAAEVTLRDWSLPITAVFFGNGKGNITADGRLVLVFNLTHMCIIDMDAWPTPQIGPTFTIPLTDGFGSNYLTTWATISPSGKFVIVHYDIKDGLPGDWDRIFDVNGTDLSISVRTTLDPARPKTTGISTDGFVYRIGHSDFGQNPFSANDDVLIGQEEEGYAGSAPLAGVTLVPGGSGLMGHVVMVRLRDGAVNSLTDGHNEAFSFHASCRNTDQLGWCYVTYWWPYTHYRVNGEVIAVSLNGAQSMRRLAHMHTDSNLDVTTESFPSGSWDYTYRSEGQAVPSRDGGRVIFASNWFAKSTGTIDGSISDYVVDLQQIVTIPSVVFDPLGPIFFVAEIDAALPQDAGSVTRVGWGAFAWGQAPWGGSVAIDAGGFATTTIRVSDTGYRTLHSDPNGPTPYPPYMSSSFQINRATLVDPTRTAAGAAWGQISLAALDGAWDSAYNLWNTDSRPVRIWWGNKTWDDTRDIALDPSFAALQPLFMGYAAPWLMSVNTLDVPLRDPTYWMDRPLQQQTYLGTGSYEGAIPLDAPPGTKSPLYQTTKPKARGGTHSDPIRNITATLVDDVNLIYQYSDAPGTVVNLYEGGATYSSASFTGAISGTTLTVSSVTGTIGVGQIVQGASVATDTVIQTGSGTTWTVSISQSVGSEAMTSISPGGYKLDTSFAHGANGAGDIADLYAWTPSSGGQYVTSNARGMFRLSSVPASGFAITADVTGEFPTAGPVSTVVAMANALMIDDLGVPASSIDTVNFETFDVSFNYVAGIYFEAGNSITGADAVSAILNGTGLRMAPSRTGLLHLFALISINQETTPADIEFSEANIISVTPVAMPGVVDPPPYRIRVGYQHNYTQINWTGILYSASDAQRQYLSLTTPPTAGAVSDLVLASYVHPNDPPFIESALLKLDDAQTVANTLIAIFGVRQRLYTVEVPFQIGILAELGKIALVKFPFADIRTGKKGIIVAEQFQADQQTMKFDIMIPTE